jgi:hypothetical protein
MSQKIRIPRSATRRNTITYAKLLRWVNEPALTGFDFEGELLRPGEMLDEAALWPSEDWPRTPVLLECAGSDAPGWGHRRTPLTYILWRFEAGQWRELARTSATSSEWCLILGPVARQAVVGEIPSRPARECAEIADELYRAIEEVVLRQLTNADRAAVLARLHDTLAAQITLDNQWALKVKVLDMPKRQNDRPKVSRAELSWAGRTLGLIGGRLGGLKRAQNLSPERLSEIGRMGAAARWAKRNAKETAA